MPTGDTHINDIHDSRIAIAQPGGDMTGDVVAGNKQVFSGDRNVNILGNLTIYLTSRPQEQEAPPAAVNIGANPYKGLSAFQETDADQFFGRETLKQQLYEKFCRLYDPASMSFISTPLDDRGCSSSTGRSLSEVEMTVRLLAILGPSGSGKSSVARAGLLHQFACHALPGKQRTRVAVFTPGTRPVETLATILARIATNDPIPVAKSREFSEELRRLSTSPPAPLLRGEGNNTHPLPLGEGRGEGFDGLRRIADVLPEIDAAPLILLIDQFEEIYSLCDNADERQQFLENLLCAAADRSGHVSVILTLRSDFLGQTQSHPRLNNAIAASNVIVPVMSDAELRQAIAEPARLAGHPLDDATIDLLVKDSEGREGALPLLQFALTKIWDGLAAGVSPAETLKQIGGVGGALAGEAQRLFERLSDREQAIARRAFLGLIQLGEGARDTRRRISVTEIVAHGEDAAQVQAVLRCFADPRARLVTLSASAEGSETAEVTHEALLDHWDLLKTWLDSSRDDLRFHRHLADDAKYWAVQQKPEGLLWRPPDLDLLRQYHARAGQEMTPLQVEFFRASERYAAYGCWLKRSAIAALLIFAAAAGIAAYFAIQSRNEALHLYHVSFVQSLLASANQHYIEGKREQAALLARQVYFLNQQHQGKLDTQIRDVLRRTLALPEAETPELLEQVCQQARRNLTSEEWQAYVQHEQIAYQPCPDFPVYEGTADIVLRLRGTPMTTDERQHLSLYVNADGYAGTFLDNRDNRFELQHDGQVVVDHATGLMWQQSGSPTELTYDDAQTYIRKLNDQKFAGYDDWRLPTVEELLSLVEKERNANGLYIDPIFNQAQTWVWSTDKRQAEGDGSAGPAWGIHFDSGYVSVRYLHNESDIRVVRLWQ